MSLQYGRALLALLLFTPFTACGDDPSSPIDAPPGIDAGTDAEPDAPTDAGTDAEPDAPTDGDPGAAEPDPAVGSWRTDFALPGLAGAGSRVEAIALGAGGTAYVGGIFSDAAGVPANNVAQWTGTDWVPLSTGLDGWVRALRLDGSGKLWAATVPEFGSGTVQRWDGTAWTTIGTSDGGVVDLAVVGDTIAVVGGFTTIGGVAAKGVAYFDANGWHAAGTDTDGDITAVAANGTGFCVAGGFTTIGGVIADSAACWDGAAWSALGAGLPGGVAVLAQSPGGTWYAGGTLTFDLGEGEYRAGIAVLNGKTWEALDGGIDNGFVNEVRAIAFAGEDVLIGGCFSRANKVAVEARFLAQWSKVNGWSELAGGLRNDVGVFLPSVVGGNDLALAADGTLWIGGLFTQAGGAPAVNIARAPAIKNPGALVGNHPVLGIGGFVDGVAKAANGDIIAGGAFAYAGQKLSSGIARFDGTTWTDLGNGLAGIVRDILVRADGSIAVAGDLFFDGDNAAFVQSTATGWATPGGRVHGFGRTVIEKDGALWLGGALFDIDGTPISNLIRLDATAWSAVGAFDETVTTLTVYGGNVVAGGLFSTVDGAPMRGLAIQSGATWAAIGGGLDGKFAYTNVVTSSPTLGLIVGGEFDGAGGVASSNLVRWDGLAWHDVAGGVHSPFGDGIVSAVLAYGNGVFVAGGFALAGEVPAENIAWFDGTAWHALGDGLSDLSESLVVSNNVLYAGGTFTVAGGRTSSGLAAWAFPAK